MHPPKPNPHVLSDSASVELYSESELPLSFGLFRVQIFRTLDEAATEHLVIAKGNLTEGDAPFLRVHSECFTGEVLGSLRCDCKAQLDAALKTIHLQGRGLVIYLRKHEGRGIGLGNKIRAYHLQQREGLDTIQANHALGFPNDQRSFTIAADILKILGIEAVRLNTNNPDKIAEIETQGIKVVEVLPSLSSPNPHNDEYLRTKFLKLGHHLEKLFEP